MRAKRILRPLLAALITALLITTVISALEPPAVPTGIIVYGANSIGFVEWLTLAVCIVAVFYRTWEGWAEYKKTHPEAKFDPSYLRTAFIAGLVVFLAVTANPPVLVGSKSLLIYTVTIFLFAYSGNEALNSKTLDR